MLKPLLKQLFAMSIVLMLSSTAITHLAVDTLSPQHSSHAKSFSTEEKPNPNGGSALEGLSSHANETVKQRPSANSSYQDPFWFGSSSMKIADVGANKHSIFGSTLENSTELVIGIDNAQPQSYDNLIEMIGKAGGKIVNTVTMLGEVTALIASVPSNAVYMLSATVQASGLARYLEPNKKFRTQFAPNDGNWIEQWGPRKIEADWAWNTTVGNSSVLVAVIDTGIDYTHPDLAANYVPLGYDWVNDSNDTMDDNGHGTHCAGIIAAVINNGQGIAGLAQVRIMAEKALDYSGIGYEDDLANAIIHAVNQGAKILSNSWGGYESSQLILDAVRYAYGHGVLVVAAAGNEASAVRSYPAGYDEVVAVTATDRNDNIAGFSSYGDWVEIAAPGVEIYSTLRSGSYGFKDGTSMACPHVSGVAALIWSQFPNATKDWVRAQLRFTADDLGDSGFDKYYGYGRINARKAVEQAPPEHDLLIFDWKKPKYIQPGETSCFDATILDYGASDEQNVTVQLLVDGNLTESRLINQLAHGASTIVSLQWTPLAEGTFNITLYIVPVISETQTQNNIVTKIVLVRSIVGQVAFEEAHAPSYSIGDNPAADVPSGYSAFADYLVNAGYNVTTINPGTIINSSVLASVNILVIAAPQLIYSYSELDAIENWVRNGGNLLLISDWGDYGAIARTVAERLGIRLRGDGISESDDNAGDVPWPVYAGENLLSHPITVNISRVEMYGGDGIIDAPSDQTPIIVTDSDGTAYWRNDSSPALHVPVMAAFDRGAVGAGRLVLIGDSNVWDSAYDADSDSQIDFYDSDNEVLALNTINWFKTTPPHELTVSLEAPALLKPGDPTDLNATVHNFGLYNETDVNLQLFINNTLIENVSIPLLANGTSHTLSFVWTPAQESIFNVTAFAPPLPTENYTQNNKCTEYIHVRYPLINPVEGDYANYATYSYDSSGSLLGTGYMNFSYDHYVEPYKILVNLTAKNPSGPVLSDWMIVNTMSRFVESGAMSGMWYVAWIETSIGIGSTINLLYSSASVSGSTSVQRKMRSIDCWEILYQMYGYQYDFLYDKSSGLWIRMNATDIYTGTRTVIELADINISIGVQYPHDLGVSLDAQNYLEPSKTTVLNATVWNLGQNAESNVQLQILINGSMVDSVTVPDLVSGGYYTLAYAWSLVIGGKYNITAYAPPVSGENVTINNAYSKAIIVRYAPKILAYGQYADFYGEYAKTISAIELSFGPNYILTELWDFYQLDSTLSGKDVLLIPEQERTSIATLEAVGEYWSEALTDFLQKGGTIIVCDYNSGYGGTYGILTGAGLMSISGGFSRNYYTLYVADFNDSLGEGVPSSFAAPSNTLAFNTSERKAIISDGYKPIVIHKEAGMGNIVLLGFDFDTSNEASRQILGNAIEHAAYMPISISPSAGSPGTETTVTGVGATPNGTVSIYWDATLIGNATADSEGGYTYLLTVPAEATGGIHEITALDVATGRTSSQPFRVIVVLLSPTEGPVGTKVVATGLGFPPETQATVTFNDMLMGYANVDSLGGFSFTLNIPVSNAEYQSVKALDCEGNCASATFTVVDTAPLNVQIDVGTLYFLGEIAEFYAQTAFKGQAVDASISSAVLYKPDGNTENLVAQRVAIGLYKIAYTIAGNETGTYTLVMAASYNTVTIRADGTSFKSFPVNNALTLMNKQVLEIKDGMALLQTDIGLINLNLAAINATLDNIFLSVIAINGTAATINTTLGTINGVVTDIQDHVATILIPGVGSIQTSVSNFISTQEALTVPLYAILAIGLVAATGATLAAILLLRRKRTETQQTSNPTLSPGTADTHVTSETPPT